MYYIRSIIIQINDMDTNTLGAIKRMAQIVLDRMHEK